MLILEPQVPFGEPPRAPMSTECQYKCGPERLEGGLVGKKLASGVLGQVPRLSKVLFYYSETTILR